MFRSRRGQATSEWMLLVSVVVIAAVAAGYAFVSVFGTSMAGFGNAATTVYTTGDLAR